MSLKHDLTDAKMETQAWRRAALWLSRYLGLPDEAAKELFIYYLGEPDDLPDPEFKEYVPKRKRYHP